MVRYRIFFDDRRLDKSGRGKLRIVVTKQGDSSMFSLGIAVLPCQWDGDKIVDHPNASTLNSLLSIKKGAIDRALLEASTMGSFCGMTAKDISEELRCVLDPELKLEREQHKAAVMLDRQRFLPFFHDVMASKHNIGTRGLYRDTFNKIRSYCSASNTEADALLFESIDKSWLDSFVLFCKTTESQNTVSRHLRDIRAVLNEAIDEGRTQSYPFRKYKIKTEESFDKSFTAEELRKLFRYECYPGGEQQAVDMFKLSFCLIGINSVDLAFLKEVDRGRVNFIRRKTHKPYSIKVQPEALGIIEKYKGKEYLLDLLEKNPNYKTFFNRASKTLRKVGKRRVVGKKSEGTAILPRVCFGSARTSWATIAQSELDIPRDVIAAALGHHTVDITTTYLRTKWREKVDDANRKVLDWVFYGIKD